MSTDSTKPSVSEPTERPSRNPIERVIVWGGIGLLLVIAGIEARAQRGYAMSLEAVQSAFSDNEEVEISLDEARQLMMLAPAETKQPNVSVAVDYFLFSWFSLFKSGQYEITLRVTSDEEQQVISFATPAAPEPAWMTDKFLEDDSSTSEESDSGLGGFPSGAGISGGGGNSFGSGRFQPPPNPLVTLLDSDGDNELSAEEIEGSSAVLQSLDANGDGELTPEEFDPEGLGRRNGAQSGFASGGGSENESGSSRPRRPPVEE